MTDPHEYRVELPDRAESVALARLFIATLLRAHAVDEAIIADAKLAVSELVTASILGAAAADVVVSARVSTETVVVAISPIDDQPSSDLVERFDIAAALFPTTEIGSEAQAVFSIDLAMT